MYNFYCRFYAQTFIRFRSITIDQTSDFSPVLFVYQISYLIDSLSRLTVDEHQRVVDTPTVKQIGKLLFPLGCIIDSSQVNECIANTLILEQALDFTQIWVLCFTKDHNRVV